jgi:hypothetical protein
MADRIDDTPPKAAGSDEPPRPAAASDEQPEPAVAAAEESAAAPLPAPAFVGASIAVVVLGALALARVASPAVDRWLTWRPAAEMTGPLAIGVAVWLASWAVLTLTWREAQVTRRIALLCLALVAIGLVLAFPPLDRLFA